MKTGFAYGRPASSWRYGKVMALVASAPCLEAPDLPCRYFYRRDPSARSLGAVIMPHPIWGEFAQGPLQVTRRQTRPRRLP